MSRTQPDGLLMTLGTGFTVLSYVLTGFSNYAGPEGAIITAAPFALASMYVAGDMLFGDSTASTTEEVSQ